MDELSNNLRKAQYGTHIIVPLKGNYSDDVAKIEKDIKKTIFSLSSSEDFFERKEDVIELDNDLNDITNKLFDNEYEGKISSIFSINKSAFVKHCFNIDDCKFYVGTQTNGFDITRIILYIFNTGVAFLAFHFRYMDIATMRDIFNPSDIKLKNKKALFYMDENGESFPFSIKEDCINKMLAETRFELFFPLASDRVFSDAYAVSVAVIPERVEKLCEFKRIAYNLQRLQPLEYNGFSEESIQSSLYAYPNQKNNSYQWCSCVGDCSISRVRCNDTIERQIDDFRMNSMALIVLALYQKYSCLLFSERLRKDIKRGRRNFDSLESAMINFKAFGKIDASSVSRIANIRNFYKQVMEVNGVNEAVVQIDEKLRVIAEHEKEKGESKINAIMIILSLFSVVSILADIIAVIQNISTGGIMEYLTILFTIIGIVSIATVSVLYNRKR